MALGLLSWQSPLVVLLSACKAGHGMGLCGRWLLALVGYSGGILLRCWGGSQVWAHWLQWGKLHSTEAVLARQPF